MTWGRLDSGPIITSLLSWPGHRTNIHEWEWSCVGRGGSWGVKAAGWKAPLAPSPLP